MLTPLAAVGVTRYHRPQKNFTTLRNSFVRDAKVSLRAFRVGAYVLSHAAGFVQTQAQLAAATGLSVNTVRAALRDLAEHRYLISRVIREHGRIIGTAYAVSDSPFTEVELAQLASEDVPSEPCAKSVHTRSAPPNKTRSRRDSSPGEEDQPSGGAADAAPVDDHAPEEEPMPTATDPAQAQLFDIESPEPPSAEPRKAQGVQAVVAAYVESWRRHNVEGEPLRADKGRIARDSKALLAKGEATERELVNAAAELGRTTWSNIATQVKIARRRSGGRKGGNCAALPVDHPAWAEGERQQSGQLARRQDDPEVSSLRALYLGSGAA